MVDGDVVDSACEFQLFSSVQCYLTPDLDRLTEVLDRLSQVSDQDRLILTAYSGRSLAVTWQQARAMYELHINACAGSVHGACVVSLSDQYGSSTELIRSFA